jgi:hypothetical protein
MIAYCYWFQAQWRKVIILMTFVTVVFRSEIVLLFGPLIVQGLLSHQLKFWNGLKIGFLTALCSICTSSKSKLQKLQKQNQNLCSLCCDLNSVLIFSIVV